MWQHAFSREVDWVLQADPSMSGSDDKASSAVGDELFFSIIGSMVYDMLSFEVPLPKVHTFVAVMCATYQKGKDLLDTLKQLVENVYRALDMSKDIKPSPPKNATATRSPFVSATSSALGQPAKTAAGPLSPVNGAPFNESPVLSRQYDLDTVIRRKMSVNNEQQRGNGNNHHPSVRSVANRNGSDAGPAAAGTPPPLRKHRGPSSSHSSSTNGNAVLFSMLSSHGAPILAMSIDEARVGCALGDASVAVVDVDRPDRIAKLEGHTDAVVAVQLRGYTLLSGSRDGTLRSWDLRATAKKRNLFSFFSSSTSSTSLISSTASNELSSGNGDGDASAAEIDGAAVSRRSLALRGHTGGVTCLEIGRQLATDRALVASGSDDGTVRLWESTRETSVGLLSSSDGAKTGGVSCLRFLPLMDTLASGCRSNLVRIWDLSRAELKLTLRGHRGALRDVQTTGDRLVTAANDRVVKVWDAAFRTGGLKPTHALREHGGPVLCVALGGPADPSICTGAADGLVRVWDLRYVQKGPRLSLRAHAGGGAVTCLQRDFTRLVSAGEDGSVRVWDLHSGARASELRAVHNAGVTGLALRDALVFSGSWDGSLRLWDVQAGGAS
jgi:WD40 repeat protein